ncbi:cerebellin-3-like [Lineus longissimus]|uniref:cerebellin-3-like n=1 Tax=Lineus longissimus TaxID=88925 RepID=UPI002B4D0357
MAVIYLKAVVFFLSATTSWSLRNDGWNFDIKFTGFRFTNISKCREKSFKSGLYMTKLVLPYGTHGERTMCLGIYYKRVELRETGQEKSLQTTQAAPNPPRVAFFVGLKNHIKYLPKDHSILKFDEVITNEGGGYNVTAGAFITPIDGIYSITVTISPFIDECTYRSDNTNTAIGIMKNDERKYNVTVCKHVWDASTVRVLIPLNESDRIWLKVENNASTFYGDLYTTFSGFIL